VWFWVWIYNPCQPKFLDLGLNYSQILENESEPITTDYNCHLHSILCILSLSFSVPEFGFDDLAYFEQEREGSANVVVVELNGQTFSPGVSRKLIINSQIPSSDRINSASMCSYWMTVS
jgi:hypothetical protein